MTTSLRPSRVIRVLVVDDSVVVRSMVSHAVDGDAGIEVVGVAANGRIALDKLTRLSPDVVVLDLDMPVMDGFDTLRTLRLTHPDLPVIVFSHLATDGAETTQDVMALGATGVLAKPTASATALHGDQVRGELVPLIRALAAPGYQPPPAEDMIPPAAGGAAAWPADALVVAVSTGGPDALAAIVGPLPADIGAPVLVVQHMPASFTGHLAERLDRVGPLGVAEAVHGEPVQAGRVYIAPGGRHMTVTRTGTAVCIALSDGPPENSCRPAADVLFRSAAHVYGRRLLGLVLTGMGHDGLRGAEAIRAAGGSVIAQDQATAVVGSMPGAVVKAGLADAVFPLDRIGLELAARLVRGAP